MEPNFEKANEIYFRLGIIYKQQQKFNQSLDVSVILLISWRRLTCFSVSNTSSQILLALSRKRISGSKLATCMSSRRR